MRVPDYTCTLSDNLRIAALENGQFGAWLKEVVERALVDLVAHKDIADSLILTQPAGKVSVREITISGENGQPLFSCYVRWLPDERKWHAMLEKHGDGYFQKKLGKGHLAGFG